MPRVPSGISSASAAWRYSVISFTCGSVTSRIELQYWQTTLTLYPAARSSTEPPHAGQANAFTAGAAGSWSSVSGCISGERPALERAQPGGGKLGERHVAALVEGGPEPVALERGAFALRPAQVDAVELPARRRREGQFALCSDAEHVARIADRQLARVERDLGPRHGVLPAGDALEPASLDLAEPALAHQHELAHRIAQPGMAAVAEQQQPLVPGAVSPRPAHPAEHFEGLVVHAPAHPDLHRAHVERQRGGCADH